MKAHKERDLVHKTTVHEDAWAEHTQEIIARGFTLNHPDFTKLAGWNHILVQISIAKHCIEQLIARDIDDIQDAAQAHFEDNSMLVAFLVTYARCFVSAEGKAVKLDPNDVFKGEKELRTVHDRIMSLRHNFAAHNAVSDLIHVGVAVREKSDRYEIMHLSHHAMPAGEWPGYAQALKHLQDFAVYRLNVHVNRLEMKLGKPIILANEV